MWVSFHFLDGIFDNPKLQLFNFRETQWIELFVAQVFMSWPNPRSRFATAFSSRSYKALAPTCESLIHVELVLLRGRPRFKFTFRIMLAS